MNIHSTNDRYLSMSVIIWTPTGVYPTKNLNAHGKTRKYANAMPARKKNMLDTISGTISFFSCWYRPGATNAQTW